MATRETPSLCCTCSSPHIYLLSVCAYHKYCRSCFEIVYSHPERLTCTQCRFIATPWLASRIHSTSVSVPIVSEGLLQRRDNRINQQQNGNSNSLQSYEQLQRLNFSPQCSQNPTVLGNERQLAPTSVAVPFYAQGCSSLVAADQGKSFSITRENFLQDLPWESELHSNIQRQIQENSLTGGLSAQQQQHSLNFNDIDLSLSSLSEMISNLSSAKVSPQSPNLLQHSRLPELPTPMTIAGFSNVSPYGLLPLNYSSSISERLFSPQFSSSAYAMPSHFFQPESSNLQLPVVTSVPSSATNQFCYRHPLQRVGLSCQKCRISFCLNCIDLHQNHMESVSILKENDPLHRHSEIISQMLKQQDRMKQLETMMKGLQMMGSSSPWGLNPELMHCDREGRQHKMATDDQKHTPSLSYDSMSMCGQRSNSSKSHSPVEVMSSSRPEAASLYQNVAEPDPSQCRVIAGLRIRSRQDASFLVHLCDQFGRPTDWRGRSITVEISLLPSNQIVTHKIQQHAERPGVFRVTYRLAINGCYKITVKIFNAEIVNSPLTFNYPSPKVVGTIGRQDYLDRGDGFLERPWGVTVQDDRVIVADRTSCTVQFFDKEGNFVKKIGKRSETNGKADSHCEFYRPSGITIDSHGRFIITDKDNHRVKVYSQSCEFLRQFGERGKSIGQFEYPFGIAVNKKDDIFIADSKNDRIVSYNRNLVFLCKTCSKMIKNPRDVACYRSFAIVSLFDCGELVVFDQCLQISLFKIGSAFLGRPQGIDVDVDGDIIVVESTRFSPIEAQNYRFLPKYKMINRRSKEPRISVFKTDIKNLLQLTVELDYCFTSTEHDAYGALNEPCGVHVTDKGEIFVVDSLNHRILIWV